MWRKKTVGVLSGWNLSGAEPFNGRSNYPSGGGGLCMASHPSRALILSLETAAVIPSPWSMHHLSTLSHSAIKFLYSVRWGVASSASRSSWALVARQTASACFLASLIAFPATAVEAVLLAVLEHFPRTAFQFNRQVNQLAAIFNSYAPHSMPTHIHPHQAASEALWLDISDGGITTSSGISRPNKAILSGLEHRQLYAPNRYLAAIKTSRLGTL
ncbi:hypothetical protein Enr10x_33320 [Gimesia panareensis]|uniref:Uncharacterized protein n=1 Tax=Gimesia panareensis TaxID=2527978 RepID=A0A517Q8P4_9PLAN|nr:hypothetical protein Enr10x_33320 [Gimesia panareensis]